MRRRALLLSTLLALLAAALLTPAPGRADGGLTAVQAHDVALDGSRRPAAVVPAEGFDLIGAHWKGPGVVEVRVRASDGRVGGWLALDDDTGPDRGTPEARRAGGWRLGEPVWVGRSERYEVRTRGRVDRARVFTVVSRVSRVPARMTTAAGRPAVVLRKAWQADERLRRSDPELAPAVRFAIVHHTAGPNTYTREDAPAVVRGILAYHVKANGWNDIGYNALVDRFGTVYEGRFGGLEANVVGAHARGFNTGSFGIAVLGEFTAVSPSAAAFDALTRALAWRLDLAHVDPLATFDVVGAGNERFAPGVPVFLRAISGHRDTGLTACPGNRLYARLPELARRVAATGLPKLYDPLVTGTWGGPLTLTARLSGTVAWTASLVRRGDGATVAEAAGTGRAVTAVWDTAGLPAGVYDWRIDAPGTTPAAGTLDASAATVTLAFTTVTTAPSVLAPDGDGVLDEAEIGYALSAPANVSAVVADALGVEVAVIEAPRWRRAGRHVVRVDGAGLPDGAYELRLLARGAGGQEATRDVPIAISRTLGGVSLDRTILTPNGDGRDDRIAVRFSLSVPAAVRVRLYRDGRWVATAFQGRLAAGARRVEWDGTRAGAPARDGDYAAVLEVTDPLGTARAELPFLADGTPPTVTLVSTRPPRVRVSEPVVLELIVNGRARRLAVEEPGVIRLKAIDRIRTLRAVATDRAGNVGRLRLG